VEVPGKTGKHLVSDGCHPHASIYFWTYAIETSTGSRQHTLCWLRAYRQRIQGPMLEGNSLIGRSRCTI
jgi:hypothetical protein